MLLEQVGSKRISDSGSKTRRSLEVARVFTTGVAYSAGFLAVEAAVITTNKVRSGISHAAATVRAPFDLLRENLESYAHEIDSLNTVCRYPEQQIGTDVQEQVMYAADSGIPPGHVPSGDIL